MHCTLWVKTNHKRLGHIEFDLAIGSLAFCIGQLAEELEEDHGPTVIEYSIQDNDDHEILNHKVSHGND